MISVNPLVIIAGCQGFIGRNLLEGLKDEEVNILGIDRIIKDKSIYQNLHLLELDLLETNSHKELKRYLDILGHKDISIVHLAGFSYAGECRRSKSQVYALNVNSLQNLLSVALEYKVKKFIFSSSALVYGTKYKSLIDESFFPNPENIYAKTKLEAENYLINNSKGTDTLGIVLRLANVYGAGMNKNTVISTILEQLNNDNLNLREYESIRDFIYIKDAILAFKRVLFSKCRFNLYNIGTSIGYSIYELVKIIAKLLGKGELVSPINVNSNNAAKLVLSYARIKEDLAWQPAYNLEGGIKDMLKEYAP